MRYILINKKIKDIINATYDINLVLILLKKILCIIRLTRA